MKWKLIRDNGTPACLPRWAKEEIADLHIENLRLIEALHSREPALAREVMLDWHPRVSA
jgi:hypothetical protein